MSVKFDVEGCVALLRFCLAVALTRARDELLQEAASGMRSADARQDLTPGDIQLLAEYVATTVVGGPHATMDEWGTGSMMDPDNPALEWYKRSTLWNPYRGRGGKDMPGGDPDDTMIRSRERGPYKNIFGEVQESRAPHPGYALEHLGGIYAPNPPSHALRTAGRWLAQGRFREIVVSELRAFPWHRFIVVRPDGK